LVSLITILLGCVAEPALELEWVGCDRLQDRTCTTTDTVRVWADAPSGDGWTWDAEADGAYVELSPGASYDGVRIVLADAPTWPDLARAPSLADELAQVDALPDDEQAMARARAHLRHSDPATARPILEGLLDHPDVLLAAAAADHLAFVVAPDEQATLRAGRRRTHTQPADANLDLRDALDARAAGQTRRAHRLLEASLRGRKRAGVPTFRATSELAALHAWAGRDAEALRLHQAAYDEAPLGSCHRARFANNLAWAQHEAGASSRETLRLAQEAHGRAGACGGRDTQRNLALTLAVVALDLGRHELVHAIDAHVHALGEGDIPTGLAHAELHARLSESAEVLDRWLRLADDSGDLRHQWRARRLLAARRPGSAVAHLEAALELAERHARVLPFELGRGAIVRELEPIAVALVEAHRARGDLAAATRAWRRWTAWPAALARSAHLRRTADTADTARLVAELEDEVTALSKDLWALEDAEQRTRLRRIGDLRRTRRAELEAAWGEVATPLTTPTADRPIWTRLPDGTWTETTPAGVRVVDADTPPAGLVLAPGGHALDIASATRWSMDVGPWEPPSPAASAVVVADTRGDLPWARAEARDVASRLRAAGIAVTVLSGDAARRGPVLDALRRVDLAHFATHAEPDPVTGAAMILLADGDVLDSTDVLAGHAPARVVLAACGSDAASAGDLSLGAAWVVSGAAAVVATTRVLPDEAAAAFVGRLYDAGFHDGDTLGAFARAVRDEAPGVYRLLTP
jgi:hypothetical protein